MPKDLNGVLYTGTIATITTTNGTGKDFGSQAIPRGEVAKFYSRVSAISGTGTPTVTVAIQKSPDNSSWTTIGTLTAQTTTGVVSGEFSGADGEYLRAQPVTTGTTISVTLEVGIQSALAQ